MHGPICSMHQRRTSCLLPAVPELTSENCLSLNVYTTKLPDSKNKVKRPVIVLFHPGGFYGFSAQSYLFGPQYYLDQDIVLVTVNYRLATFGFMSTGDARAPGNRVPVYNYQSTYQGRYSFAVWSNTQKPYGVVHHDDLLYLFYMSFGFPFFNATDPESAVVEKMTTMWANFAKTGEPIPKYNKLFKGVTWPSLQPQNQQLFRNWRFVCCQKQHVSRES
ncbi:uncharacterized protein LOC116416971 [Nasonia vitripennis]|uniref:Carboxylesterase type B domain-containing protein n=1 Tax=Nasonia vitripennis TaxID=7425 RepID=A0A7M7QB26_NASVI|nr:uncharacterized protein LOC116416971 [Nasonia vitripennis]